MRFAREAWPFVLPFPLLALVQLLRRRGRGALLSLAAGAAVLLFFRDPERYFDGEEDLLVAPADGVVIRVDQTEDADIGPSPVNRVATFLSVFDVHVQRVPATGVVVASVYRHGKKRAAMVPNADTVNESQLTVIERPGGDRIGVRQIAGLLARRVVTYVSPGQPVRRGQHLGLIKFGSRVDLLLPADYEVLVRKGDRLRNGATPIARAAPSFGDEG